MTPRALCGLTVHIGFPTHLFQAIQAYARKYDKSLYRVLLEKSDAAHCATLQIVEASRKMQSISSHGLAQSCFLCRDTMHYVLLTLCASFAGCLSGATAAHGCTRNARHREGIQPIQYAVA